MTIRAVIRALATTLVVVVYSCSSPVGRGDSESHFLATCDAWCGAGLDCICGVCTRACVASSACSGLGPGVECAEAASASCSASRAAKICDFACSDGAACRALGANYECVEGHCRQFPTRGDGGGGRGDAAGGGGGRAGDDGGVDKTTPKPFSDAGSGGTAAMGATSSAGGATSSAGGATSSAGGATSSAGGAKTSSGGAKTSSGADSAGTGASAGRPSDLDGAVADPCSGGEKFCGGVCTQPSPSNGCGRTGCVPCSEAAPNNGYLTCQDGACIFDCLSGFTKQGSSCVADVEPPIREASTCNALECPTGWCTAVTGPPCCTYDGKCGCPVIPYVVATCTADPPLVEGGLPITDAASPVHD